VATFIVGFILNARLTGILMAAVIPSMTIVVFTGTTVLNRYSKITSESTTTASAIASGAIKAVQVVQAFDAFGPLVAEHESSLKKAMVHGVRKSVTGAILLGSVFFIALVMIISIRGAVANLPMPDSLQMHWLSSKGLESSGKGPLPEALELSMQLFFLFLTLRSLSAKLGRSFSHSRTRQTLGVEY
jgi:ABC transporter transmembrane region